MAALLVASCAPAPDDESIASLTQPIIGGTADGADPSVMLLVSYPPGANVLDECTAVLVSPTTLVTAAHCVDAATHPGHTFGVFPGADGSMVKVSQLVPVVEVHAHPAYDAKTSRNDVGVVVLSVPLGLPIVPVNRVPLDGSFTGKPARIVGYGRTDFNISNSAGARRQATTVIGSFDADTVLVGDNLRRTCLGDSGAPAFIVEDGVEVLLGTNSSGPFGCAGPSTFMRADRYLDFLSPWLPPPLDMARPADLATPDDLARPPALDLAQSLDLAVTPPLPMAKAGCGIGGGARSEAPWWPAGLLLIAALRPWARRRAG